MATPEGKVKEIVKRKLKKYSPHLWYFMPVAGQFGRAGVPDFIGCFHGKFFSIETKGGGGKPTPLQDLTMGEIRHSGGAALVIDETNYDDLDSFLEQCHSFGGLM